MAPQNGTPDFSDGLVSAPPAAATPAPATVASSFTDGLVPAAAPAAPAAPAALPSSSAPVSPTLGDRAMKLANEFVATMPVVGQAHELAGLVQDWASKKAAEYDQQQLARSNQTGKGVSGIAAVVNPQTALRVVGDTAGLVRGATTPAGLATAAATVAAPEVMAPILIAQGIKSGVQGWGDLRNPDVLQNELNSAAQVVGGLAMAPEAYKSMKAGIANESAARAAGKPLPVDQSLSDFKASIPPSKFAPYQDNDVIAAKQFLDKEHITTPIDGVEGVRDAADTSIGKIESHIDNLITQHPDFTIKTSPLHEVAAKLRGSVNRTDLEVGLNSLQDYDLGWVREGGVQDPPLTLEKADRIRARLNQENKAVLKKNGYDVYTARETDPAFAAREAAAESLRDGIYNGLEELGHGDVRSLRLTEGSLIKIRNAAENNIYKAQQAVKSSANKTPLRAGANAAIRAGGAVAGGALGGAVAGPVGAAGGAVAGEMAAAPLAESLTKIKPLTRDELMERAFKGVGNKPTVPALPAPVVPANIGQRAAVAAPQAAIASVPQGMVRIQDSRGGVHEVPQASLPDLQLKDPGLKIIGSN